MSSENKIKICGDFCKFTLDKSHYISVLKMSNNLFVIERARPEEAAELLDYLKIVGGETNNLSFGAASDLMEEILAFAKENGFEQLNLEVRSSNTRAIHLYEKYGFRKLCTFPHFFKIDGEYIDFDLMNLELDIAGERVEEDVK